jgi:hypothetical protein
MTAPEALAQPSDLEDMWRPLADSEMLRAVRLIQKASALLRQAQPHIDNRIALFSTDPTNVAALDPTIVATVVATIVKRFIANVEGVASQTVGPYSVSYALRVEKDIRGELQVTENDLQALRAYKPTAAIGSIRVKPSLAPWPIGDYGPVFGAPLSEFVEFFGTPVVVEMPVPIYLADRVD